VVDVEGIAVTAMARITVMNSSPMTTQIASDTTAQGEGTLPGNLVGGSSVRWMLNQRNGAIRAMLERKCYLGQVEQENGREKSQASVIAAGSLTNCIKSFNTSSRWWSCR